MLHLLQLLWLVDYYLLLQVVFSYQPKKFLDQVKVKDISQLINGISNFLPKLLRCFNGTKNSTSFVFHSLAVFPVLIGSIEISLQ